ncbi:MAG: hypothetical protein R2804_02450 [Cyclobacteriaceae bacterium]
MPNAKIELVSSQSFEETLRLSYEKALVAGKYWSLIIDADILLARNFFSNLLPKALKAADNSCLGFSFRVWDRFYNSPKYRGIHIYKTEHLKDCIVEIPPLGEQLRPESFVKKQLEKKGASWLLYGNTVGLHDFFQKPSDIFAKMAMRANRSADDLVSLENLFEKQKNDHVDFLVALAGLEYGRVAKKGEITNSRASYVEAYNKSLGNELLAPNDMSKLSQLLVDWKLTRLLATISFKLIIKNQYSLLRQ